MLNKEKLIDNICPPNKRFPKRFFFFKRKPEGKKGVGEARGGKGEVAFSLSPRRGRSLALPSPLSFPSRFVL